MGMDVNHGQVRQSQALLGFLELAMISGLEAWHSCVSTVYPRVRDIQHLEENAKICGLE